MLPLSQSFEPQNSKPVPALRAVFIRFCSPLGHDYSWQARLEKPIRRLIGYRPGELPREFLFSIVQRRVRNTKRRRQITCSADN